MTLCGADFRNFSLISLLWLAAWSFVLACPADSLNRHSRQLMLQSRFDEAIDIAQKVIPLCIDDVNTVLSAYQILAVSHRFSLRFDSSLYYIREALEYQRRGGFPADINLTRIYVEYAGWYSDQYEFEEALHYMDLADSVYRLLEQDQVFEHELMRHRANIEIQKGNYSLASMLLEKVAQFYAEPITRHDSIQLADALNGLGTLAFYDGAYFRAMQHYESAGELMVSIYGVETATTAMVMYNIGLVYSVMGLYNEANKQFEGLVELWHHIEGEYSLSASNIYIELGNLYADQGEPEKALSAFHYGISIREHHRFTYDPVLLNAYTQIALVYANMQQYNPAGEFLKKAESLNEQVDDPYRHASFLLSAATLYSKLENYRKALSHLHQLLGLYDTGNSDEPSLNKADAYLNLGLVYMASGDSVQAKASFWSALRHSKDFGDFQPVYLKAAAAYSRACHANSCRLEALEIIAEIICRYEVLMDGYDAGFVPFPAMFLEILASYISLDHEIDDSVELLTLIGLGENAISYARNINYFDRTQLSWLGAARDFLDETVATAYRIGRIEHLQFDGRYLAYRAAEASKSIRMLHHLHTGDTRQHFNLPESLFREEQELKFRLAELQYRWYDLIEDGYDHAEGELSDIAAEQMILTQEIYKLQNTIRQHYPEYHRLLYGSNRAETDHIMQLLEPGEVMLMYHFGRDSVYGFTFNRDGFDMMLLGEVEHVRHLVSVFRDSVLSSSEWEGATSRLLESVIVPLTGQLLPAEKWVVIPDDKLFYLPFDLLLKNKEIYQKTIPLVVLQHSASLWVRDRISPPDAQKVNVVAFAPWQVMQEGNEANSPMAPLVQSGREAAMVARVTGGKVFTGVDANLTGFWANALEASVLHIATHGLFNENDPGRSKLVFQCNPPAPDCYDALYARDVFHRSIPASLVVLSACNTGLGNIVKGEGLASLSTAFQYAGGRYVVLSLWAVPDRSTAILMEYFYSALSMGLSVPDALTQAKKQTSEHTPALRHPIHWAGFQTYGGGDVSLAMVKSSGYWKFGLVTGLILLTALAIWRLGWAKRQTINQ